MPASEARRVRFRTWLRRPLDDTRAALESLAALPSPLRGLPWMGFGLVASWFVYVPVHELLHVLGCVATGGSVSELQLDPIYGAAWLAEIFPFVVAGGEYAGRLSGFDTRGSDLVYLAADFAPYLLSVAVGVPLLRHCARRARPVLVGVAAVLALAPFYNVAGDYYEMGSILATRAAATAVGAGGFPFASLRSDDLIHLSRALATDPEALGLAGTGAVAVAALLVAVGTVLSIVLAFLTYAAGRGFAELLHRGA